MANTASAEDMSELQGPTFCGATTSVPSLPGTEVSYMGRQTKTLSLLQQLPAYPLS